MTKSIRLHLGCGTVYLKGYKNIDIEHPGSNLVKQGLVDAKYLEKNIVTKLEDYYVRDKRMKRLILCDEFGDIRVLGKYDKNSIKEIVCFHVLEHLYKEEAEEALKRWIDLLKIGGRLRLMVPDIYGICTMILNHHVWNMGSIYEKNQHCYRLIYGSYNRKSSGLDSHKHCWDKDSLKYIFIENNMTFKIKESLTDNKFNPSLYIEGVKHEPENF